MAVRFQAAVGVLVDESAELVADAKELSDLLSRSQVALRGCCFPWSQLSISEERSVMHSNKLPTTAVGAEFGSGVPPTPAEAAAAAARWERRGILRRLVRLDGPELPFDRRNPSA
jgi:hypothetical protein